MERPRRTEEVAPKRGSTCEKKHPHLGETEKGGILQPGGGWGGGSYKLRNNGAKGEKGMDGRKGATQRIPVGWCVKRKGRTLEKPEKTKNPAPVGYRHPHEGKGGRGNRD